MASYLVTGAAGFIGFHTALSLLDRGDSVVGVDNVNDYYSTQLKRDRLAQLAGRDGFEFHEIDIADLAALRQAVGHSPIDRVIHLAAQAGVRYSIDHPEAYVHSNLVGHLNILEFCRHSDRIDHMVYASSSSVYGGNTKLPFSEDDRVDQPISLYAATKKADELMSHVYSHLYGLSAVGLRFFTVYGPWGRPDMAMWLFTRAILAGEPIKVFNHGKMRRDFTYIDDIVTGVVATADRKPPSTGEDGGHRVYNIGNHRPEDLMHMIAVLEDAIGLKAEKEMLPMQPGDVEATYADIEAINRDYGFEPSTSIEDGIPRFVDWYRSYHGNS
jgi:UDP-glucuronate 4-epimerase